VKTFQSCNKFIINMSFHKNYGIVGVNTAEWKVFMHSLLLTIQSTLLHD